MPRRSKPKNEKRDWRWYASFVLNAAVALSMVLGTVFLFTGGSAAPQPTQPTISVPTLAPGATTPVSGASTPVAAPTATPASPAPAATPTPKASAGLQTPLALDSIAGALPAISALAVS